MDPSTFVPPPDDMIWEWIEYLLGFLQVAEILDNWPDLYPFLETLGLV